MTIVASFAELEREKISERTREAKRYLASQGVFIGGSRPFGFDLLAEGKITRTERSRAGCDQAHEGDAPGWFFVSPSCA
jgi:DNA invertase Pin-like site-specific DNA recombinase